MPDFSREHTLDQRLWDELGSGVQTTVMNDSVSRIAGHKNNFCSWPTSFNFVGELSTVLAGQHHVRKQQIEFLVGIQQPKRGCQVFGLDNLIIQVPQDLGCILANTIVILDDKDRFASTAFGIRSVRPRNELPHCRHAAANRA